VSHLLIAPDALAAAIATDSVTVLDARPASAFAAGHVPGAVSLDVFGMSLVDTRSGPLRAYEWMMQHLFELRGVRNDRPVVAYEDDSGMRAARLVWLLAYLGHPDARLLDGGLARWRAEGKATTRDASEPAPSTLAVEYHPERLATVDDVLAALERPEIAIVDTRSDGEFRGTVVRAARGGAVPGAVHVEWTRNLAADGRYRSPSELRAIYAAAGVTPDREVITYCQGGYRAAQTYIALVTAGYPRVRSYLGSWNEWGNRLDLPIVVPSRA
jgi:thiosulfate/3-mercaptopyruvate sulfurtransferase